MHRLLLIPGLMLLLSFGCTSQGVDVHEINLSEVQESGTPIHCNLEYTHPADNTTYEIELYVSGDNIYLKEASPHPGVERSGTRDPVTNEIIWEEETVLEEKSAQIHIIYDNVQYRSDGNPSGCDWGYTDLALLDECALNSSHWSKRNPPSSYIREAMLSVLLDENVGGECFYGGFGEEVFQVSGELCNVLECQ